MNWTMNWTWYVYQYSIHNFCLNLAIIFFQHQSKCRSAYNAVQDILLPSIYMMQRKRTFGQMNRQNTHVHRDYWNKDIHNALKFSIFTHEINAKSFFFLSLNALLSLLCYHILTMRNKRRGKKEWRKYFICPSICVYYFDMCNKNVNTQHTH